MDSEKIEAAGHAAGEFETYVRAQVTRVMELEEQVKVLLGEKVYLEERLAREVERREDAEHEAADLRRDLGNMDRCFVRVSETLRETRAQMHTPASQPAPAGLVTLADTKPELIPQGSDTVPGVLMYGKPVRVERAGSEHVRKALAASQGDASAMQKFGADNRG